MQRDHSHLKKPGLQPESTDHSALHPQVSEAAQVTADVNENSLPLRAPPFKKSALPDLLKPYHENKLDPCGSPNTEADGALNPCFDHANFPPRKPGARHYARSTRMLISCIMRLIAMCSVPAFLWFGWKVVQYRDPSDALMAVSLVGLYAILRLIIFNLSFKLTCTLCHGNLLQANSAHKHRDALRIPFLGWVWPVILSTLTTSRFRCMYCGTLFRIKK